MVPAQRTFSALPFIFQGRHGDPPVDGRVPAAAGAGGRGLAELPPGLPLRGGELWPVRQLQPDQGGLLRAGPGEAARPVPIPLDTAHLDLSSNAIRSLSAALLSGPGYTTLVSLDLSYNLIGAADADAFSRLRYLETLDLSNNALESLRDGCFSGLPLTEVDLSGNRLAELRLAVFSAKGQGGRPLSVDASGNQLTAVTRGAGGGAPELQSLTLAGTG
ncbi:hypothetical protein ANANG_G00232420 [Anguilla anguilla]|uniref:Uncharacterized protein n=1 Tax=Anguilla anguilla TaxID=7936 RepID=A0A9D3LV21_ANGAN|nr:hypothetical protein ANANG_G00232420 [Anguilla anguilla]